MTGLRDASLEDPGLRLAIEKFSVKQWEQIASDLRHTVSGVACAVVWGEGGRGVGWGGVKVGGGVWGSRGTSSAHALGEKVGHNVTGTAVAGAVVVWKPTWAEPVLFVL